MLNNPILWTLLFIHIFCSLIYVVLILLGRSHLRKEHIIPIILVPVFGLLMGLVIDLSYLFGNPGHRTVEFESVRLENDIYWKSLKQSQENSNVIPLEEAILINDNKTRRKVMLETLEQDPIKYMDILMVARENEDVETVHYATTQISKEQRYFQLELQKFAVAVESDPDNIEILDAYIDLFDQYFESGLLEEVLLMRQRILYSQLLDKKLTLVENDRNTLIKKLRNFIALGNYSAASEISDLLKQLWPLNEETWIESLRVCVEAKDPQKLRSIIYDMQQTAIDWTRQGKEQVRYWTNV
jgi:hypothetical protein